MHILVARALVLHTGFNLQMDKTVTFSHGEVCLMLSYKRVKYEEIHE